MSSFKEVFMSVVSTVFFFVIVIASLYYFVGETVVTADVDGVPLKGAIVYVNDEEVGTTPYTARLGFGEFHIKVVSPSNHPVEEESYDWQLFTVVVGKEMNAPFTGREDGDAMAEIAPSTSKPSKTSGKPGRSSSDSDSWFSRHPVALMGMGAVVYLGLMSGLLTVHLRYPWPEEYTLSKDMLTGGLLGAILIPSGLFAVVAVLVMLTVRAVGLS